MKNKQEAASAVIKMQKELLDMSYAEFDKGTEVDSPYSKVYWLYQDIVNFMDGFNQSITETFLDEVKWLVEHPKIGMGYDTGRYRQRLEMAILQMGHGLNVDWSKHRVY